MQRNSLLSSDHHLSTTNIKALSEQCGNKEEPQAPSLQRQLTPADSGCAPLSQFLEVAAGPSSQSRSLAAHTPSKSPHLIFTVEKDQEAVDSAANREGGPSTRLAPEKQADGLNGATIAKKKIPIRSQFYH